jgi:hypothetical protein
MRSRSTVILVFSAICISTGVFAHRATATVLIQNVERSTIASKFPGMAPPCIAKLNDGRLLSVWSTGGSGIVGAYSADSGRTWSPPQPLFSTGTGRDWDPSIVVSGNRILVTATVPTGTDGISTSVTKCVRSDNSGQSWSPMYEIPMNHRYTSGKVGPGVRLQSGTLLMPYSWDVILETPGSVVHGESEMRSRAGVMRSTDNGLTWNNGGDADASYTRITPSSPLGTDEPKIIELSDRSVYMLIRTGSDHLYQARSRDEGQTWTDIGPSPLFGSNAPAAMTTFALGGRQGIVAVWDNSLNRFPLVAAASFDAGATWTTPVDIAGDTAGYQASYPNIAQAVDGAFVVVWNQQTAGGWDVRSARFTIAAPEPSAAALLTPVAGGLVYYGLRNRTHRTPSRSRT